MTLRILHVLDHSIPHHSGYAFRTLALLTEQRRMGWDTIQLTTPKQGVAAADEEDVDGWTFHRTRSALDGTGLRSYLRQMTATRARIDQLVERFRPDILHAHSPVLNAIPAIRAGRAFGLPVVYEMRASWEDAAVDHGTTTEGSLRYRLSRRLETWALRHAAAITTICDGLRKDILVRGKIEADKVFVIPNAVDVDSFPVSTHADEELRLALGLRDETVLGFAGSFYGYEGLDLLLEAFALLSARHPRLRLLLIGSGPQEQRLKEQAARLGLEPKVIFTGRVPHNEVSRYYSQIDVLCYPRTAIRLTELVTPLKPLEAMAQGKLLVASDVGGHRELIRDGETGVLFRAGDVNALVNAVERLLAHPEDWPTMRAAGRSFVEVERTWAGSAAEYRRVYRSVLPPERASAVGQPRELAR